MLIAVYSALLAVGLVGSAPWWLARMMTTQKYREGLRERLGRVPARLRAAVAGRRVVWVHAVSVGEVLAVSRLVGELEMALNGSLEPTLADDEAAGGDGARQAWRVVVSTTTRTGQALARERFGVDRVFYFPLDFAWAVRAYLRALRPEMLVLAESELWPRMLVECERAGVPVAVVNARVSDRSFRRSMGFRRLWARMLRKVRLLLAQSDEDARRLVELGAAPDAVRVSGNLKYDVRAPKQSRMANLIRNLVGSRPVIVAGSTVGSVNDLEENDEEEQLAEEWPILRESFPSAVLVVAPRHPERFGTAAAELQECGVVRATDIAQGRFVRLANESVATAEDRTVVLLNTVGDLASVYSLATVAFVGGSLVQAGGHNPLEPARFGVPVVMGPSFENFRDVVGSMQDAEAIRIVKDRFELVAVLRQLLTHPDEARAMGERGRQVFEQEGGATARSIEALMGLVSARGGAQDGARAREAVSA